MSKEQVIHNAKEAVLAERDIPEAWFSNESVVRFYSKSETWYVMFIAKEGNEMVQNVPVQFIDVSMRSDGSIIGISKSH